MKHHSIFALLAFTAVSIIDGHCAPPPWVAPASASSQRNPFAGDPAAIARGKELYQGVCIACHGNSGAGDGPAGLALPVPPGNLTSSDAAAQSDGALHWKIVNGRAPMPGFAGAYGKDDLWKLVSYIRTLSPGDGPAPSGGSTAAAGGASNAGTVSRGEYNRLQNELTLLKAQMLVLLEKQGLTPEEVTPEDMPPPLPEADEDTVVDLGEGGDLFPAGMSLAGGIVDPASSGEWDNAAQLPSGRTNFLITGFAFAEFENISGEDSTFGSSFSPIFLWKQGENLMFEAELEVEAGPAGTEVDLGYAQMLWAANDYMTIGVGKFLNPASYFGERIHPAWINKLPNAPFPFAHGTALMAGSQTGLQVRGGIPIPLGNGKSRMNYAFYASNGPALTVGGEAGHDEPVGGLEFNNNRDQNNNKAVGGRVGFLPVAGLEVGYGFESARVDPTGLTPAISGINAFTHVVDASYVKTSDLLKGTIDVRSQFVWLGIDNPGVDPLNFTNDSEGGYAQLAYRPLKLENEFIQNLEFVSRFDWISLPVGRADMDRWTWGMNYWLNPSTVLKASYETGNIEGEGSFRGVRVQAAMGF